MPLIHRASLEARETGAPTRSCGTGWNRSRQIRKKRLLLFDFIREVGLANAKC